jgi:hypothetical protein
MANNYTQGSAIYRFTDPGHKTWLEAALEYITVIWDDSREVPCWREPSSSEDLESFDNEMEIPRYKLSQLEGFGLENTHDLEDLNFGYEIGEGHIWFYGEEFVDAGAVADLMNIFFKENDLHDAYFSMSSADTCDKLRVDALGGGAAFATSKCVKYMSTYSWIQDQIAEFTESRDA